MLALDSYLILAIIDNNLLYFSIVVSYTKKPLVGIIMGSSSDSRIMKDAAEILDKFKIKHEDQIISAHRTPTRLDEYAKHAEKMGFRLSRHLTTVCHAIQVGYSRPMARLVTLWLRGLERTAQRWPSGLHPDRPASPASPDQPKMSPRAR